jgi:osmotically-inducible protein OsmY
MPEPALHLAVMQALADNPRVHADEITVEANGADVILRGTAGTGIQRAQAARTVQGVPGVERVDDHLTVRPARGPRTR